jgi:hypothetical protein
MEEFVEYFSFKSPAMWVMISVLLAVVGILSLLYARDYLEYGVNYDIDLTFDGATKSTLVALAAAFAVIIFRVSKSKSGM